MMIRFSCLCLLICAVAIFPRLASAAHPCDVHQEPQKRKICLQQHEENQRRAEAQARAQAQQKQREQAERQRQAQVQREQQERQKQEQMQAQRRQIEQQQAAERKRQQAQVEAQRRAEEVRQQEAVRRVEAKRLALIESQKRAEAERLAKAARDKEDRERLLAQKKRNESGADQSAGKSGDKSGGARPQSVAQAGGRNPVVSAPDPTRTASPQLVCDVSATPKVTGDFGVTRCSVSTGGGTIAGAPCSCYSQATARNYGGVVARSNAQTQTAGREPQVQQKSGSTPVSQGGSSQPSGLAVCDVSAAPKVTGDTGVTRCAVQGGSSVITGSSCSCYSAATANVYGGVVIRASNASNLGAAGNAGSKTRDPLSTSSASPMEVCDISATPKKSIGDQGISRCSVAGGPGVIPGSPCTCYSQSSAQLYGGVVAGRQTRSDSSASRISSAGNAAPVASAATASPVTAIPAVTAAPVSATPLQSEINAEVQRRLDAQKRDQLAAAAAQRIVAAQPGGAASALSTPVVTGSAAPTSTQQAAIDAEVKRRMIEQQKNPPTGDVLKKSPATQTEATKQTASGGASSTVGGRYPIDGRVSQSFGVPWSETLGKDYKGVAKTHTGVDIEASGTTVVKSMTDGIVYAISDMGAEWGRGVVIKEPGGTAKGYLHLKPQVKVGDSIKAGQQIGVVWKDHLHFNVCKRPQFCERGALPTSVRNPEKPGDPLFKDGPFIQP